MTSTNHELHAFRRKRAEWLILDLDDTLLDTSEIYYRAREGFLSQMTSLGFARSRALETFERIEAANIRRLGIFPERYGRSMRESYLRLCAQVHALPSKAIEQAIASIGNQVIHEIPRPLPGAMPLLKWLHKHYMVFLITRGVAKYQMAKVKTHGLNRYIDKCFIVPAKTSSVLRDIGKKLRRDIKSAWVIGDSIKSDINPGLRAGAQCILYEYRHKNYYWRQEYGDVPEGKFFLAKKLSNVRDILENPDIHSKHCARLYRRRVVR